jgi:hypothetical protein
MDKRPNPDTGSTVGVILDPDLAGSSSSAPRRRSARLAPRSGSRSREHLAEQPMQIMATAARPSRHSPGSSPPSRWRRRGRRMHLSGFY